MVIVFDFSAGLNLKQGTVSLGKRRLGIGLA
jgi:hypothetical protein